MGKGYLAGNQGQSRRINASRVTGHFRRIPRLQLFKLADFCYYLWLVLFVLAFVAGLIVAILGGVYYSNIEKPPDTNGRDDSGLGVATPKRYLSMIGIGVGTLIFGAVAAATLWFVVRYIQRKREQTLEVRVQEASESANLSRSVQALPAAAPPNVPLMDAQEPSVSSPPQEQPQAGRSRPSDGSASPYKVTYAKLRMKDVL